VVEAEPGEHGGGGEARGGEAVEHDDVEVGRVGTTGWVRSAGSPRRIQNSEPPSGRLRAPIFPPMSSTRRLLMASSRPELPKLRGEVASESDGRSKIVACLSAGMAGPVSVMLKWMQSWAWSGVVPEPADRETRRTTRPWAVNFTAFDIRFNRT
jgi:hypothetical protein